jgi:hypothetical protein
MAVTLGAGPTATATTALVSIAGVQGNFESVLQLSDGLLQFAPLLRVLLQGAFDGSEAFVVAVWDRR